jgi:hypothetical protein
VAHREPGKSVHQNLGKPREGEWEGRARKIRSDDLDALRADTGEAITLTRTLTNDTCARLEFDVHALAGFPVEAPPGLDGTT